MWFLLCLLSVVHAGPRAELIAADVGRVVLTSAAGYATTQLIVQKDGLGLRVPAVLLLNTGAAVSWSTRQKQVRYVRTERAWQQAQVGTTPAAVSPSERRETYRRVPVMLENGQLEADTARSMLRARLTDEDPFIRMDAMGALLRTWDEVDAPATLLTDPDPMVRREVIRSLSVWGTQPGTNSEAAWVLLNTGAEHETDPALRRKWMLAAARMF